MRPCDKFMPPGRSGAPLRPSSPLAPERRTVHVWGMRRRDLLIRLGLVAGAVGGAWWLRDHVLWKAPGVGFPADGASGWLDYAARRAVTPTVAVTVNVSTTDADGTASVRVVAGSVVALPPVTSTLEPLA